VSWRELFHEVLPRHALAGEDLSRIWQDRVDNPKTGEPIGSGPFLVERLERGRQLTLVRNPRYWGPHTAYLESIVFRFVQGDLEALRSGQLDVFFPNTAPDAEGLVAIEQGVIKVLLSPGSTWEHLAIRLGAKGHPALESRLVRRALAYGIDREAIVRAIYGLVAPRKKPLDSVVFPRQSRFYEPHWNVYRYRPAEARRLLEQAGCRRGPDRIYACGGRRLSLRFLTTGGFPPRELTLRLVQAQLRRAGVEVVPEFAPSQTLFLTLLQAGRFDVVLHAWVPGADTDLSVDIFRCEGPSNHTGYCNRQVSRDLLRSRRILDAARRAALLNRVDAQLAGDVPVIPLYQAAYGVALRPILRGVVPADPPDYLTWNSEDWWLAQ
jgi:peptide/nickel transport system substrate-binding protein